MIIFTTQVTLAQVKTIKGVITDGSGAPLPSANVIVKGESNSVSADFDGTFSIEAKTGSTLIISYVGFETQNVVVGEANTIKVQLKEGSSTALTEVVVTSLGIKKTRKSLTYSAQELKGEELVRVKSTNPINNLSGKISGLTVNKSASGAGGSVKVTIRGNSSTTNNQPLYVIDGVPMLNASPSQGNSSFGSTEGGNRDGGDAVSLINPDDIESMTVLKGASATALYGSQGARGVVLITTKKGKEGKVTVNFSSNLTVDTVTSLPDFQTIYGAPAGGTKSWGVAKSSPDHVEDFYNTGFTAINSIGISSGSDKATTNFTYANTNVSGVIPTNELKKHNLSFRQTVKLNDKFDIDALFTVASQTIDNRPVNGLYFNPLTGVYLFPRGNDFDYYKNNFEVFDPARNLMTQNWPSGTSDIIQNPFWILNRNKSIDTNQSFKSIVSLNYKFTDWLSIKARGGYDKMFNKFDKKMYAGTNETLAHANGRYIYSNSENSQLYGDLIATINTKINDDISFNANVGTNITKTSLFVDTTIDSGKDGGLKYANWFNLNNFNSASTSSQTTGTNREIQSVFASATFGYKDLVYLDLTGRNDWSSTLVNTDKEDSGYFYPSVGVTTILSQMFKMPESISFAKVRASYAQVGNDLTPYLTSPTNTLVNGNVQAPINGPAPGTSLKPESQNSFEIGTEWRFVGNRFGIDLTYYNNTTKDQLITIPAPLANPFGYKNYVYNAGSIENKGIELTLNAKAVKTDNFSWDTSLNYASNKNKVVSLSDDLAGGVVLTEPGSNNYRYSLIEGRPFGVIEGINILKDDQGRILLDDTGRLQKTDWEEVGNANPDFMLGWSNSFTYKKFSLNFIIDGRFGGEVMSMTQAMLDSYGVSKTSGDARDAGGVAINALNSDGTAYTGLYPAQSYYEQVGDRNGITGEYVYSATNVKLGELSLGYNFDLKKDSFLKTASLSLVGRNLFFFYNEAPFDPNVSLSTGEGLQGVDVFGAPSTRSIGVNLNVSF